ncbi:MAG TPA: epoxyqueuosine reductase QueH [Candidatus Onthocola stercoravium]|nr:epoxyqueuosine reductase QueH [Candidatus Onthocola stercoravium]
MKKMNYQNKMQEIINSLDYRPRLLLHSCCGPCSTTVLTLLVEFFDITVLYYNPNIEPMAEYEHRKKEQIRFIKEFNNEHINFMDCDYNNQDFRRKVQGLEQEREGGARCAVCFKLRLNYTASLAKKENFDYFGTTLTVSPHKNSDIINKIGSLLEKEYGVKYLYSDFKKKDGYKKSVEISKKYNLYRQDYCGCLLGRNNI